MAKEGQTVWMVGAAWEEKREGHCGWVRHLGSPGKGPVAESRVPCTALPWVTQVFPTEFS